MRNKTSRWMALSIAVLPLMFGGCQFMPQEEVFPDAPVIESYEVDEYVMTTVERGDLALEKTVKCRYVPAKEEEISFVLGGEYIERIHVSVGDSVHAGQLLAELEQEALVKQIAELEYQQQVQTLKKKHLEENRILKQRQLEMELELIWDEEEEIRRRTAFEQEVDQQLEEIEDALYIQGMQLGELKDSVEKRQIYAGIDGTVTFIRDVEEGQRSVEGQTFIKIADIGSTAFTVEGSDAEYLSVGTEMMMTLGREEVMAVVVDASTLGLNAVSSAEDSAEETAVAYLQLVQPDPTLKSGDSGTVQVTLDSRENVLYVDAKTVKTTEDGKKFVYVLDEAGLKVMQDVTTGLETGAYIEIVSGLHEGDNVILE